jgi:hypothetical protein
VLCGAILLVLGLAWLWSAEQGTRPRPYSRESFDAWLTVDAARLAEYRAFERFLSDRELHDVVPAWQLTRSDSQRSAKCVRPQFLIPPREQWPNVVPALRLLRDEIKPALGDLEVVSSYRTEAFNGCAGGAARSKHLRFEALDLLAPRVTDQRELFRELCSIQHRLGPASRFGLGAYFDPARPGRGVGRFHVDAAGYRSWGFGYAAASSGCRAFD